MLVDLAVSTSGKAVNMAQETLRGHSLGAQSFESETNVVFVERQELSFHCPAGHVTKVVFADEAELPASWVCRICSADAVLADDLSPADGSEVARPGRSHWQMLLERRSTAELEEILNEQLVKLRERRARGQVDF
ncbi:MAG: hypothetical protein RL670_664 [Actinomycetota bacterium]|jgi:primosomal protein N'